MHMMTWHVLGFKTPEVLHISIIEVQELHPDEVCSVVGDDIVWNTKPIDDVEEEFDHLFRTNVGDGLGLYLLGEFVDRYK